MLLSRLNRRQTELRHALLSSKRLQLIRYRCPLLNKRLTIVNQFEHLAALFASRRDRRELSPDQKIQNGLGIPKVILMTRERRTSDQSRIADLELHSVVKEQLFKPPQTPGGFRSNNRVFTAFAVERFQRLLVRMKKPSITDLSITIVNIRNRLFVGMKVNPNVYCHR